MPYVESIFKSLLEKTSNTEAEKIFIKKNNNEIICEVKYSPFFNYDNFLNKIRDSHNGSFIGKYFIEYYDLLMAHGNFLIKSKNIILFDAKEFIVDVVDKKIILNEDLIPNNTSQLDLSVLELIFINELIL